MTWRIERHFGWCGLFVTATLAAIIGPVRDRACLKIFPEWGAYGAGIAPWIAVAAIYGLVIIALGHVVMHVVSGPSDADHLAIRARAGFLSGRFR